MREDLAHVGVHAGLEDVLIAQAVMPHYAGSRCGVALRRLSLLLERVILELDFLVNKLAMAQIAALKLEHI